VDFFFMVVVKLDVDLDVGCSRNTGNPSTFFYYYLFDLIVGSSRWSYRLRYGYLRQCLFSAEGV